MVLLLLLKLLILIIKRIDKIRSSELTNENLELLFKNYRKCSEKNILKKINKYINKMHDITGAYYYHIVKKN